MEKALLFFAVRLFGILGLEENPKLTYYKLYQVAIEEYEKKNWEHSVILFEKALEDYEFYHRHSVNCRISCRKKHRKPDDKGYFDAVQEELLQFEFLRNIIFESNCMRKCTREIFEDRPTLEDVEGDVRRIDSDFQSGRPFYYIQFCYYQLNEFDKAASATYTYFKKNPNNTNIMQNLHFYRTSLNVKDSDISDLDRRPYQAFYLQGEVEYAAENWTGVIENFEKALEEFYKEEERCRILCENQHIMPNQIIYDFIHFSAKHYISVLKCQNKCEEKLSRVFIDHIDGFLEEHYHYLQYAYYKTGELDKAAEAIGAFLLFNPFHVDMLRNKIYYTTRLGYHDSHFNARKEAREYVDLKRNLESLVQYIKEVYESNSAGDEIAEKPNIDHYMKIYEKAGIKLVKDDKDLRGARFAADGLLNEDKSLSLINLANVKTALPSGIREVSIPDAVQLVKSNAELETSLRVMLTACANCRFYTARFFNLTNLFIKDAKILCREPVNYGLDSGKDHCFQQETGECVADVDFENKEFGQDVEDDILAVLYLNDVSSGGQIHFLSYRNKKVASLSPKQSRLVGFYTTEKHMVSSASSERCVLLMMLTTNKAKDNPQHRMAMLFLNELDEERIKKLKINHSEAMTRFENEGVKIILKGKELHGEERFVADGLATNEQCKSLIDLLKSGGIQGDGYKGKTEIGDKISPHTKYEIFEGLTVSRASKLAKMGKVSEDVVHLFLDLTEKGKLLVQNYFNLSRPLYFDYTHLVCRKAIKGYENEDKQLSHPVHADNCQLKADGSCLRQFPAYIQRDYSAVIYLNDENSFDGGEFFFAHANTTEQVSIKPKCGRLVGFNAGEFHGVKAVKEGQRCAVAMWYTMDPNTQEVARIQARQRLESKHSKEAFVQIGKSDSLEKVNLKDSNDANLSDKNKESINNDKYTSYDDEIKEEL